MYGQDFHERDFRCFKLDIENVRKRLCPVCPAEDCGVCRALMHSSDSVSLRGIQLLVAGNLAFSSSALITCFCRSLGVLLGRAVSFEVPIMLQGYSEKDWLCVSTVVITWDRKLGSITDVQEQQREYSGLRREVPKHLIPGHLSFLCVVKYTLCNNYVNKSIILSV